ncbi:MAG: SPOR domain-containing protein [Spirochaetaceae bacterium]|nr:SPOR domain-containing protein [Spirochaetaceae bacterium]
MKKLRIAISGLISLAVFTIVFTGASPWEGPAAVALGGELPDGGYYVATNSFPRNTVVDVTNLETGKTVRVIVASGLDSSGFLAILSRKAAGEVGLQGRSIARIRMSQPGDPIAFSRFTDGVHSSTDPDYNPQAALGGATGQTRSPALSPAEQPLPDSVQSPAVPQNIEGYDLSLLPAENRPPASPAYQGYLPPEAEIAPFNRPPPEETQAVLDESRFIAPIEQVSPIGGFSPPAAAHDLPVQRLPSELNHANIMAPIETVPPIPPAPPPASPGKGQFPPEMAITEIAPIERISPLPPAVPASPPQRETAPPLPSPAPEQASAGERIFSAPLISSLERSKYYLQLRAFTQVESVEQELSRIGKTYPLVVLRGEESGKTLYRILLGPVNQGESNALLRRFKNMGYKDAFVRQGS